MMLTEEQRALINEKRLQALANKKRLQEELESTISSAETLSDPENKKPRVENEEQCLECSSKSSIDKSFAGAFSILLCRKCIRALSKYELLPKGKVIDEYLLPESIMKKMKFITKENPRNKNWTGMKLYLRKFCEEEAIQHFGSLENLTVEIERRKSSQFERALERSTFSFSNVEKYHDKASSSNKKKFSQKAKVMAMVNALVDDNCS